MGEFRLWRNALRIRVYHRAYEVELLLCVAHQVGTIKVYISERTILFVAILLQCKHIL